LDRNGFTVLWRRGVWLGLLGLVSSSLGCSDDAVAGKDGGAVPRDGGSAGAPDVGTGGASGAAPREDGSAGRADASAERRFAVASAKLLPVDAAVVVQGTARFRATDFGVDLELTIAACGVQSSAPVEILEAGDCSQASLQAKVWKDGRGAGIPSANCAGATAGFGALRYERRSAHPDSWTVGDSGGSDVIGKVLVLRDDQNGQPRACGVIERDEDVVWTPLPPPEQPPSTRVRGQIAGLCFAKQFTTNATEGCPDSQALLQCSSTHCDVGGCLAACSEVTSCLDAAEDPCAATFTCPQSDACAECQNALLSCTLAYCAEDLTCVPPVTPDGPCSKVLACCALQGEDANRCLPVFPTYLSIGGDASCIGAILDREAVGHLKDPCTFDISSDTGRGRDAGAPVHDAGPEPASQPLADEVAGTPSSRDADCPGGLCAPGPELPETAASGGFCTRACTTKSQCGFGGTCVANGDGEGRCFGSCGAGGECRAGFRCTGAVKLPVFGSPGACLPLRPPEQLGAGVAGRTCSVDADCPGGHCAARNLLGTKYPDNYCTARCYKDGECGAGGVCLVPFGSFDAGYCLLACETHQDCKREGYRCRTMNDGTRLLHACYPGADPMPDHSVGLPCQDQSACGGGQARCATEMPYASFAVPEVAPAPGGYCTQPCALDEECGAGAECVNVNTRGGLCFANCSDNAPCRDGYTCQPHLRDDNEATVCVPVPPMATPNDAGP
jgi:hypothetical protein